MYIFYDKEVDNGIKVELKRLLYWISEAKKLNPQASLSTILNSAADYIDSTTFAIYKERDALFNQDDIIREAEEKTLLLEDFEKTAQAALEVERQEENAEDVEDIVISEDIVPEITAENEYSGEDEEDELVEETIIDAIEEENVETTHGFDVLLEVDYGNSKEESVEEEFDSAVEELETLVEETEPKDFSDNTSEETEHSNEFDLEDSNGHLPSREDKKEEDERQNRQNVVRENFKAIFGNQEEISDL